MVDIYRSRKGYNFRCLYWNRNENGIMDNEELIHSTNPNGIFYAKIISSKAQDKQDIVGVFRVGSESIMIETQDVISINKDDLIQFDNAIWMVGRVNTEPIQKNAEFSRITSVKTTIELYKGV